MVVGVGRLGAWGGSAAEGELEDTGSYLGILGSVFSVPHPPPQSPFYYSNWEQNIWTQHCFRACSCIPASPPPSLCGALPIPLGLGENKESLQGREWVGTAPREDTEPQM